MAYPTYIQASLIEINGNSCGVLNHRMKLNDTVSPPEYRELSGEGDFSYARCWRVDLGGGSYTWDLRIRYTGEGACYGLHDFRRATDADDPTGDYCIYANGQLDCSAGKAGVIEST